MTVLKITAGNGLDFYVSTPEGAWNTIVNTGQKVGDVKHVEVLELSEEEYQDIPATIQSYEATRPAG